MGFDINKTGKDMFAAMQKVLVGKWPVIEATAKTIIQNEKETLGMIADARIKGDIDDDEMVDKLENERQVFKIGLLTLEIGGKKAAQDAINAALDVFWNAVKSALIAAIP